MNNPQITQWSWLQFSEISVDDMYDLLKLRQDVFALEQECLYPDIDGIDRKAWHVLGKGEEGNLCAYSRVVWPGFRFDEPSIGRVVTAQQHRMAGCGRELMQFSIAQTKQTFPGAAIRISAQAQLEKFYLSLGFSVVSEPYDEDGIPHIEMLLL